MLNFSSSFHIDPFQTKLSIFPIKKAPIKIIFSHFTTNRIELTLKEKNPSELKQ